MGTLIKEQKMTERKSLTALELITFVALMKINLYIIYIYLFI